MAEYPGLELFQEDRCLLVTLSLSGSRQNLDEAAVRSHVVDAGYAGWALFDEAVAQLLAAWHHGGECQRLLLGEQRDAAFSLEISSDAMQVWLALTPACGGKTVLPEDVFLALGEAGVTAGVDTEVITTVCRANVADRVLVASGVPAVDGDDAHFELLVSDARDRSPQVNEHGFIDFRELGEIPVVTADQPLMRRIPATPGQPGCNVRGESIEPQPGCDRAFSDQLIGAYVDKDDANLLRAVFSGQPVCSANGVNIEHVLHLRNVNMATGNIAFDGTVQIDGEVLPGMKVNATGDIIVGDVVDGAILDAGGDIQVGGGVIAKASVRAAGAVTVRFVENARVYAGSTLAVEDSALQADLQANNQILVGLKNQHGKLAGGSARAMLLIRTPILGSATGGVTQLVLGVNPVLDAKYHDLLQLIEQRKVDEDKLDKLVKHLLKQGDKSGMLERANASWQAAIKAWGELLPQREALEKEMAQMVAARVEVGDAVAGAVDMAFGKKLLRQRQSLGAGTFSLQGDQVVFADATGHAVLLA